MAVRLKIFQSIRQGYADLGCAVRTYLTDGVASEGAALAFYSAFSLAPLLLILVVVLGWLIGSEHAQTYVHQQLRQLIGGGSADAIVEVASKSHYAHSGERWIASLVSIGAILLGATSVFAEIQTALDRMWRVPSARRSGVTGWMVTRLWSLGLVLTIGFLLLISLAVATWLAALSKYIETHWYSHGTDFAALTVTVDLVSAIALHSALFAMVYRFLPAIRLPWRIVLLGGTVTALLFYIGRIAIGFYLARAATASLFGAAASFAVLLLWLYYSAQIFLFGAQLTVCIARSTLPKQAMPKP